MTFRIGRDENFFSKRDALLLQLNHSYDRFFKIQQQYKENIENTPLINEAVFSLKGLGNNVELTSCFKEHLFASRELLDLLLYEINKKTEGKTNRDFIKFMKKVVNNEYDNINLPIIHFIKNNIKFFFNLRKIRNELKYNITNVEFRLETKRIIARMKLIVKNEEIEILKCSDIKNLQKALENKAYYATLPLDEYFPDNINGWTDTFKILELQPECSAL